MGVGASHGWAPAVLLCAACSASTGLDATDAGNGAPDASAVPGKLDAKVADGPTKVAEPDGSLRDAPFMTGAPDAPGSIDDAPSSSTCGACPEGTHCGSANDIPVCRDDVTNVPRFSHVFVIVMENLSYATLVDKDNASASPFLHGLMGSAAFSSAYRGVAHPSLPNYIAMTSGDTQGIGCDCAPTGDDSCDDLRCNAIIHSCNCSQGAQSIADEIEAAGLSWRAYGEGMGVSTPCNLEDGGAYAVRHVPFLYYTNIQSNADRCASHVVDYQNFGIDSANDLATLAFIAPNLTNDMHDPILPGGKINIRNGDSWLATTGVAAITALDAYRQGGLVVIVWDEDDYSGLLDDDDTIPLFLLSPYAKVGYESGVSANHYSLLATLEDGLGLPRLGHAASAQPLADFFPDR